MLICIAIDCISHLQFIQISSCITFYHICLTNAAINYWSTSGKNSVIICWHVWKPCTFTDLSLAIDHLLAGVHKYNALKCMGRSRFSFRAKLTFECNAILWKVGGGGAAKWNEALRTKTWNFFDFVFWNAKWNSCTSWFESTTGLCVCVCCIGLLLLTLRTLLYFIRAFRICSFVDSTPFLFRMPNSQVLHLFLLFHVSYYTQGNRRYPCNKNCVQNGPAR